MIKLNKKGFTLIEILVVVAIIAILASVVLIGLGPTRKAGRDARRISDMRQVQQGLELYFNHCGVYPNPASAGAGVGCAIAANTYAGMKADLTTAANGLGINTVPDDPSNVATLVYSYGVNLVGTSYSLWTQLEDPSNPAMKTSAPGA